MLAAELALAGVDTVIAEQRLTQDFAGPRALGLHARSLEVLDQRGVVERFLAEGQVAQVARFGWIPLDLRDFPTRHRYGLGLSQIHVERILAGWVGELGVQILRGQEVIGLAQDESGVDVELSDGGALRCAYLVGCDGGRSLTRKTADVEFLGWDATTSYLIAEVELVDEPEWGIGYDANGVHSLSRSEDGAVRALVTEQQPGSTEDPTLADLRDALVAVYGTDFGAHSPVWISRFSDAARQAVAYRRGRVLLAGDAAHVHHPVGGQGLNIGLQDAVNLGWKLARVVAGTSPERLLDTYQDERHPVAARVLQNTLAQQPLLRSGAHAEALRECMAELLSMDEPRRRFAAMQSGLGVHYDLGEGHPLLGRRMPDLDLRGADAPMRVFALLHRGRAALLNFGPPFGSEVLAWADRVQIVDAAYDGAWELPAIGAVSAPSAVLVRPDGHVAWVGEGSEEGLLESLRLWFGWPHAGALQSGARLDR
jgi:2-polyprenyl-6-methoxyphenol hydroxylase-like FAD-dependent oxidoreductase